MSDLKHVKCTSLVLMTSVLWASKPAWADAWGASWGKLNASVSSSAGTNASIEWNTNADDYLIYASGDVWHMHPPLTGDFKDDYGTGGLASVSNIQTGDLARVGLVSAGVAGAGGPFVDMSPDYNIYSYAHDVPSSSSDAAGLGQHDNRFSIHYNGSGSTPTDPVMVTFLLEGTWNLAGDSDPDDDWSADWFAMGEIYDPSDASGASLASDSLYHFLAGPGSKSDGGLATLSISALLSYDTIYSFRFFLDLESHAQATAVPAPSAVALLVCGLLVLLFPSVGRHKRLNIKTLGQGSSP